MSNQIFQYNGNPITFQIGEATVVNATQMAKPFGKRPIDWMQNQQTKDFLNELSKVRKSTLADLVQVTKGGNNPGTWFHEDVALEFARWLSPQFAIWCNDRIKELMRYGMTATPQTIDNILADPDNAIRILTALKEERKKNKLLEDQNHVYQSEHRRLVRIQHEQIELLEVQAPKVEYANNILNSATTYTTTQIAKELGLSAQYLNFTLKSHGVIEKKGGIWTATENYIGKGYLTVKSYPYRGSSNRERTNFGTVWTEAGRNFIHSLIDKGTLPFK